MNCSHIALACILAAGALLSLPTLAEDAAKPAKMSATEAVIENGKVVLKAKGARKPGSEEEATEEPRSWLVEVKSGAERPYPLKPIPTTNLLMCRPAGFAGGL